MYQKGLKNDNKGPTAEVFAAVNTIITNQRKLFLVSEISSKKQNALMATKGTSECKYEKNKNNKGKGQ